MELRQYATNVTIQDQNIGQAHFRSAPEKIVVTLSLPSHPPLFHPTPSTVIRYYESPQPLLITPTFLFFFFPFSFCLHSACRPPTMRSRRFRWKKRMGSPVSLSLAIAGPTQQRISKPQLLGGGCAALFQEGEPHLLSLILSLSPMHFVYSRPPACRHCHHPPSQHRHLQPREEKILTILNSARASSCQHKVTCLKSTVKCACY